MTKPKDPEVIEEMRAAGRAPEDETPAETPAGDAAPAAKARGPKRAGARSARNSGESAGADTSEQAAGAETPEDTPSEPPEEPHLDADARDAAGEPLGEPQVEPAGDHGLDYHPDEPHQRSFAATALMVLIGIIVVASGTLWAAPRVAPHLPAGIGQYLMPGQVETTAEIADLRRAQADSTTRSEALIAALDRRLAAAEAALGDATGRLDGLPDPEAAAAQTDEALTLARDAGTEAAALDRRLDATATELVGLRESVAAINDVLTGGGDGSAAPAELSAAVAALNARLDSLAGAVANRTDLKALEDRIGEFAARIDAIESSAADARSVQSQALGEVSTAIRQASLRSAIAALTSHVEGGQPYAAPLAEVAALTGAEPPEALAAGAGTGLADTTALGASFGPQAQAAIAADVRVRSGEGTSSQVVGWLRAQVTGRPVTEQAGEGVGAITSRIAARIREGALDAALTEAEALPAHSQAALGFWLDQLRARVEAEAALSAWLIEIGVNG